ncbi:MAG: hypothetical protein AVDCRST_MAG02-3803 [uncultured Rubrobacteraceae bacterium]|uniref:Uncharacterized protein n=1 Tax=uncultured Rubrobacteraceae bacterium TaxID=349277 RepID=A0A6J4REW3_9ACTN|nr:MAG: hypothetical protein AVDCRST_MAG02-3803 [uncultured Rubrobacteraceae bacterium]
MPELRLVALIRGPVHGLGNPDASGVSQSAGTVAGERPPDANIALLRGRKRSYMNLPGSRARLRAVIAQRGWEWDAE